MTKLAIDGGQPVRTDGFPAWPVHGDMESRLLQEVLQSGEWGGAGGSKNKQLVEQFTEMQDAKYGVTVVNGTLALTVALQAVGVEPGDEVIMPPFTFIASATSALMFGAIPVFVDIEEDTLMLDPELIEAAITPKTKAIMAVHMGGGAADMSRIKEIADKHNLKIVEDAAQSQGAKWEGKGIGAIGDIGTFSFQNSKNMTAGEGGMIITDDLETYEKAWSIANVGRKQKGAWYDHFQIGWNLRLTEFQAAVLLGQMSRIDEQLKLREKNARRLDELLSDIRGIRPLRRDPRVTQHAYHLYGIRLLPELTDKIENKAEFLKKVQAEGIPLGAGYTQPIHQNEAVLTSIQKWTGEARSFHCPVAERMCTLESARFAQNVLLADDQAMIDIAIGIKKVIDYYLD